MIDIKEYILFDKTPFKITFFFEICYVLIPIIALLYIYVPLSRPIMSLHMICVGIIGSYDTLLKYEKNKYGIVPTVFSLFAHLILLIIVYKNIDFSMISIGLLILALFVIYKLPYWPYETSRLFMAKLYVSIYVGAYIMNKIVRSIIL